MKGVVGRRRRRRWRLVALLDVSGLASFGCACRCHGLSLLLLLFTKEELTFDLVVVVRGGGHKCHVHVAYKRLWRLLRRRRRLRLSLTASQPVEELLVLVGSAKRIGELFLEEVTRNVSESGSATFTQLQPHKNTNTHACARTFIYSVFIKTLENH